MEGLEPPPVLSKAQANSSRSSPGRRQQAEISAPPLLVAVRVPEAMTKRSNIHVVDFYLQQVAHNSAQRKNPGMQARAARFVAVHPFSEAIRKRGPWKNFWP